MSVTKINQIERILANLSPENLTRDGEASASWVRTRRAQLVRELRVALRGVGSSSLKSWVQSEISLYVKC
jgi:hypothetical protein